jgi:hypothetical protein
MIHDLHTQTTKLSATTSGPQCLPNVINLLPTGATFGLTNV